MQVSAFHELKETGEFGVLGLRLLGTLMTQELSRFPTLSRASADEPDDYVQEFFVDRGMGLTLALMLQASDDDSFARFTRRSIRNWLIDQVRKTALGSLYRQVESLLGADSCFQQVPNDQPGAGGWRMVGSTGGPWGGDPAALDAVAASVKVRAVRGKGTERRAPLGERLDLGSLVEAILTCAGGSLETAQIVGVFARRFPAVLDPLQVSLDDLGIGGAWISDVADRSGYRDPERRAIAAEDDFELQLCALTVFEQLSHEERQIVIAGGDIDLVRTLLGCGRSVAYTRRKKVLKLIEELAGPEEDLPAVFEAVQELCKAI